MTKIARLGMMAMFGARNRTLRPCAGHHVEFGGRRLRTHAEAAQRRGDQDDLTEDQQAEN
jgi:hypothetical protein